jgi:hypothetical protein
VSTILGEYHSLAWSDTLIPPSQSPPAARVVAGVVVRVEAYRDGPGHQTANTKCAYYRTKIIKH